MPSIGAVGQPQVGGAQYGGRRGAVGATPRVPQRPGGSGGQPGGQQQVAPQGIIGSALAGATGGAGTAGGTADPARHTVTPGPIYSPQQTQEATNAAFNQAIGGANMPQLIAQQTPLGQSVRSPSATARVLPEYAGALANAASVQQGLPFADAMANAQHILGGQQSEEGGLLDWQQIDRGASNVERQAALNRMGPIFSVLQGFLGG